MAEAKPVREQLKGLLAKLIREERVFLNDEEVAELQPVDGVYKIGENMYFLWPRELPQPIKRCFYWLFVALNYTLMDANAAWRTLQRTALYTLMAEENGIGDPLAYYYATAAEVYGAYDLKLTRERRQDGEHTVETRYFLLRPFVDKAVAVIDTTFDDGQRQRWYSLESFFYACDKLEDGRLRHVFAFTYDIWEAITREEELPCA